ncbi:unnamed protein product, partial [Sphenostylis stenocarpa]
VWYTEAHILTERDTWFISITNCAPLLLLKHNNLERQVLRHLFSFSAIIFNSAIAVSPQIQTLLTGVTLRMLQTLLQDLANLGVVWCGVCIDDIGHYDIDLANFDDVHI